MYSMQETYKKVGMTYQTLKFYCNQGLIPNVKRDKNNYRVFDDHDIEWIKSLSCLKKCGMSIEEMKQYLSLCLEGESTIPARQVIIAEKKEQLLKEMKKLQDNLDFLNWKENFYNDVLSGKIKYYSNLIIDENKNP